MNGTSRGLNRALLGVLGLALVIAGFAVTLAGAKRGFAQTWTQSANEIWASIQERLSAARITGGDISWWTLALIALLLVVAVLLVCWIASQGTGRSNQLASADGEFGSTKLDTAVAGEAIKSVLAENRQVLSTSVQSWKLRGGLRHSQTGLKVSLQVRKGASVTELVSAVDHLVAGLDALLGTEIPVLVRIKAGTRSRFARSERVT